MEIKKKSAVYALQEENENFVLTADLTVDLNNRLVANGTVRSRVTPERGFTFYYQTAEDGTVSYSTAGCPNCEATATEFVYSVVSTATQQITQGGADGGTVEEPAFSPESNEGAVSEADIEDTDYPEQDKSTEEDVQGVQENVQPPAQESL